MLFRFGLADIRQKARMRGANLREIGSRLVKAQLAIYRKANFFGIRIFLAVVLPPADGTQLHGGGRIECFVSTAGATITNIDRSTHKEMDAGAAREIT